ncbi:AmmeMemoRadiSam system radical SAM enzyme [bacterium]|nr:MAG: AmmeMemoRadiSam system radical SAM enzyme [bacterium]
MGVMSMPVEAMFWESLENNMVQCKLCPHNCRIKPNDSGICRIRGNIDGKLYATGYAETTSLAMDPIEKKPLFHFKPGSYILSVAPNGCNLCCKWCQNWEISQSKVNTQHIDPDVLITIALGERANGIAFTYSEPLIWYEYIIDVAKQGHSRNLSMVAVTNGYINPEPLEKILPYIDAFNIDLKSMNPEVYKKHIGGKLEPVLETIKIAAKYKLVEITYLIIPTINDMEKEIHRLVDFIAEVNPDIPLHFSRYYPSYQFDVPPTSPEILMKAYQIAKQKLSYVYIGNLPIRGATDTRCPKCGNVLVKRHGFSATKPGITTDAKCSNCGRKVDIVL